MTLEIKSEKGKNLMFSTAFVVALECWANNSEVRPLLIEATSHEKFDDLRAMTEREGLSRNDILLESLCATISLYLQSTQGEDNCVTSGVMLPLAAQLIGLGVISIAPTN